MKRTSISTAIICALFLTTSAQAQTVTQQPNDDPRIENCLTAQEPYVCVEDQYAQLEEEFNTFWQQEQDLEDEFNQLLDEIYQTPDNDQKATLVEKLDKVYKEMEGRYQESEDKKQRQEGIYDKAAQLDQRLSELYAKLEREDNENRKVELENRIEELEQHKLELHVKALEFGFKQLDSLHQVVNIKEDFIAFMQEYLSSDQQQDTPDQPPEIDRNISFDHTEQCFDQDNAVACLRAVRQESGNKAREAAALAEDLYAQVTDLEEQHQELKFKGYQTNDQGDEIFAEIEQQWQAKQEVHDQKQAYYDFFEELNSELDSASEKLNELADCSNFCETDEEQQNARQEFEQLHSQQIETKAKIIELNIIISGLQNDINGYMEKLVDLGGSLLANGLVAPQAKPKLM